jgi:hypothetical protein
MFAVFANQSLGYISSVSEFFANGPPVISRLNKTQGPSTPQFIGFRDDLLHCRISSESIFCVVHHNPYEPGRVTSGRLKPKSCWRAIYSKTDWLP